MKCPTCSAKMVWGRLGIEHRSGRLIELPDSSGPGSISPGPGVISLFFWAPGSERVEIERMSALRCEACGTVVICDETECLACGAVMATGVTVCPQCGWTYEVPSPPP